MEAPQVTIDLPVEAVMAARFADAAAALSEFARLTAPQLTGPTSAQAFAMFDAELPNIIHALDTIESAPLVECQQLFLLSSDYLGMRSQYRLLIEYGLVIMRALAKDGMSPAPALINIVATAYSQLSDHDVAEHLYRLIDLAEHASDPVVAGVCNNLGAMYMKQGKLHDARSVVQRALDIARRHHDPRGVAMALMNLAEIERSDNHLAKSLALAREALELVKALGDFFLEANFTGVVADLMVANGAGYEAEPVYETALQLLAAIQDRVGTARTQFNYALLCHVLGHAERAAQLAQQSIVILAEYDLVEAEVARQTIAQLLS